MSNVDDRDVVEEVSNLLGFVADKYYEGWDDYWADHSLMEERITNLLREWERICRENGRS